jgi:hypothetical protein
VPLHGHVSGSRYESSRSPGLQRRHGRIVFYFYFYFYFYFNSYSYSYSYFYSYFYFYFYFYSDADAGRNASFVAYTDAYSCAANDPSSVTNFQPNAEVDIDAYAYSYSG